MSLEWKTLQFVFFVSPLHPDQAELMVSRTSSPEKTPCVVVIGGQTVFTTRINYATVDRPRINKVDKNLTVAIIINAIESLRSLPRKDNCQIYISDLFLFMYLSWV